MLISAASYDDDLMMKVLGGEEPTDEEIKAAIRAGVLQVNSSLYYVVLLIRDKGVRPMLDGVIDYLPSPIDVPAIKGTDENGNEIES